MSSPSRARTLLGYVAMVIVAVGLVVWVQHFGASLTAPAPAASQPTFGASHAAASRVAVLPHVLLALAVIVLASRAMGMLFRALHQPPVMGEVIAGIVLGPSLLGRISPAAYAYLLPPAIAPPLEAIAQIGVILFMFLVGLEVDTSHLKKRGHTALAISHASILAPFVLGSAFALVLYPRVSSRDVPFSVFVLFSGVSMSVTAFPVLARILTDKGMHKTQLGVLALTCAAVDDVTAWCLLAFVVSVASAHAHSVGFTVVCSLGFVAVMLGLVRPLLARVVRSQEVRGAVDRNTVGLVLVLMLFSALATEWVGIHALFGAFLLGAIIPHASLLARELKGKLEDVVLVLLLPTFFALTGMRTQLGLVSGAGAWLLCGGIVLVACAGKFGGTFVAAKLTGLSTRDAAAMGALMNTRGLMELVVLHIGLDLRVISPTLFAMMVVMAVLTTLMTSPLLHWILKGEASVPNGHQESR